jgi:hypothetical protein
MEGDSDRDLELAEDGGCTGRAFTSGQPAVADLVVAEVRYEDWNMTEDQQTKVKQGRGAMLALPIRAWHSRASRSGIEALEAPVIATLGLDTTTPFAETGWAIREDEAEPEVVEVLVLWADVISKIMT